ncbi:interleukin-36 receptor antagonist protein-like [Zootoca vivipara]|uniref:interleukin-36 receptor antagonist protein-like n=1 Tax=Zootoca vivipara TaxID=8524 RepID=UPI001590F243|nr:interleukin-36 receptor antagonist protein-like [Zootoca vivipara]
MKPQKKTWDEEMTELFCEFRPGPPTNTNINTLVANSEKQPRLFRLWDISQKFLFLVNNMLLASSQQSGSSEQLMAVVPNLSLNPTNQPIFMGLSDNTHTLNCVLAGKGQPKLQLVERNIMDLYRANEEFKSFTFYSKTHGSDETCSFESAAFPGWFLSTWDEPNRPLDLSRGGTHCITSFYFERKDSV